MSEHMHSGHSEADARPVDTTQRSSNGALPEAIPPDLSGKANSSELSDALARLWLAVKRLPAYAKLSFALGKDPGVSGQVKAILMAGGCYAVSPVDLVPGLIPVAGQLDDLYVLLTAIQQALKRTPPDIADRHLAAQGIRPEDIDNDLQAVRDLVRVAVVRSVVIGGKALGRVSRATIGFANEQLKRRNTGRTEESR